MRHFASGFLCSGAVPNASTGKKLTDFTESPTYKFLMEESKKRPGGVKWGNEGGPKQSKAMAALAGDDYGASDV